MANLYGKILIQCPMCCEIVVILDRSTTESLFYRSNIVIYIRLYEYVCMCVCARILFCVGKCRWVCLVH